MVIESSAGGVVFRHGPKGLEVLIGQHSGHHGWVFPKGLIGDTVVDEGKEETALREVREETGITGEILHPLTPYTIFFTWKGERHKKTVYYYVMKYVSGETKDHDWEMTEVLWLPIGEIEDKLTYPKEKALWREAKEYIESTLGGVA